MNRAKNRLNDRYGRLVVIQQLESVTTAHGKDAVWLCQCDCGNTIKVRGRSLGKTTKSCGCFKKERLREANSLPVGQSAFNQVVHHYTHSARKRKLEFNLTVEDIKHITQQPCVYCNSVPNNGHYTKSQQNGLYIHNGIDRVNNTQGYIIDNVVACCAICNRAKGTLTIDEWNAWINQLITYQTSSRDKSTL